MDAERLGRAIHIRAGHSNTFGSGRCRCWGEGVALAGVYGNLERLAAPAVTETDHPLDVERLARAMHNGWEGEPCPNPDCLDIAEWRRDAANLAREYAALAAPAVNERGFRKGVTATMEGLETLGGYDIDAYLASPQAAEELARATEGTRAHMDKSEAAAILAALQKVRHPEEA